MELTTAQLQILKNDIFVTKPNVVYNGKTISSYVSNSNYTTLAAFYNSNITPSVNIWRPDIKITELPSAILMSEFVALTAVKQNGYFVLTQGDYLDATDSNTRTSFTTIFGSSSITKTNLLNLAQRVATYFEALFIVNSVCSVYGYLLTETDIKNATQI